MVKIIVSKDQVISKEVYFYSGTVGKLRDQLSMYRCLCLWCLWYSVTSYNTNGHMSIFENVENKPDNHLCENEYVGYQQAKSITSMFISGAQHI